LRDGLRRCRKNSGFDFVLKGCGFSRAVSAAKSIPALQAAEKLQFGFVLKGRGFKPRRKCHKINPALAAEGARGLQCTFSAACSAVLSKPIDSYRGTASAVPSKPNKRCGLQPPTKQLPARAEARIVLGFGGWLKS
jgi:hypothetical protein